MNEINEKEYRGRQLFKWINSGIEDYNDMTNISKELKCKLSEKGYIKNIEVIKMQESKIDKTQKYLMKLNDGNVIECVLMKYTYGYSICISTQVGCNMNCSFCASAIGGKIRDLTAGEMVGEILETEKISKVKISNIVLMGTGEPLDNFDNVIKFLNIINNPDGLNIGMRHITISTCGIVPKIKELADMKLQLTLAISLHAPNDRIRQQIMPVAKAYSINGLMDACKFYIDKTNKRVTFEYALIDNVNDRKEDAVELSKMLKGMLCHVNLISLNSVVENNFNKPKSEDVQNFKNQLSLYGIDCTIRRELGSDIDAACGQLRRKYISSLKK